MEFSMEKFVQVSVKKILYPIWWNWEAHCTIHTGYGEAWCYRV